MFIYIYINISNYVYYSLEDVLISSQQNPSVLVGWQVLIEGYGNGIIL